MTRVLPYLKFGVAIFGAVVSTALVQFPDNRSVQTWGPIVASIVTALGVYAVPNKDPQALHQDESVQPPAA
jgi:hypothetical protein